MGVKCHTWLSSALSTLSTELYDATCAMRSFRLLANSSSLAELNAAEEVFASGSPPLGAAVGRGSALRMRCSRSFSVSTDC